MKSDNGQEKKEKQKTEKNVPKQRSARRGRNNGIFEKMIWSFLLGVLKKVLVCENANKNANYFDF